MSEFTSGSLTLLKYKEAITEFRPVYINDLNNEWVVFITEDTFISEELPESCLQISEAAPVLYFYNFEDHCWGYRIVHNGQEVASVHVSYELEHTMLMNLAEERYSEVDDLIDFLYIDPKGQPVREQLIEEIGNSDAYKEAIDEQFENRNVDSFKLFNISDDLTKKLEAMMNSEFFLQLESEQELVEQFKVLINVEEMSWLRADRIPEQED